MVWDTPTKGNDRPGTGEKEEKPPLNSGVAVDGKVRASTEQDSGPHTHGAAARDPVRADVAILDQENAHPGLVSRLGRSTTAIAHIVSLR